MLKKFSCRTNIARQPACLRGLIFIVALLLTLCGCSYTYRVTAIPSDAVVTVAGEVLTLPGEYKTRAETVTVTASLEGYEELRTTYAHKDFFQPLEVQLELQLRRYPVSLTIVDGPSCYTIDRTLQGLSPAELELTHGQHTLLLEREGYAPQEISLDVTGPRQYAFRHQKEAVILQPVGVFACGRQPKQVNFSPDDNYLYITLLDDIGFQVFDVRQQKMLTMVEADSEGQARGFVEGLFIPAYDSYLVSQMNTNSLYEYSIAPQPLFKRRLSSAGIWPKVIAYCPQLDLLAASNWISDNVSLLDYASGNVVHTLPNLDTPRGIAFTPDGTTLIVASFDGGYIKKFSTADWSEQGSLFKSSAAMRHVVISADGSLAWVNDMWSNRIFEIEVASFTIRHTFHTYNKTNTIALTPDERYLIASCRGPNNPESYLYRSPENGRINIFNLSTRQLTGTIFGGNQCTGLDISSDGRYLAFSNFKDNNFELYDLSALGGESSSADAGEKNL